MVLTSPSQVDVNKPPQHCDKCFKDGAAPSNISERWLILCKGCFYNLKQWMNFLRAKQLMVIPTQLALNLAGDELARFEPDKLAVHGEGGGATEVSKAEYTDNSAKGKRSRKEASDTKT